MKEWLPWLNFTTELQDTQNFIQVGRRNYAEGKSLSVAIVYKGEIAGMGGFNTIDQTNKVAKIGYWLGKKYQGNGIMTQVERALTNYALNELKLNKVEIRCASGNMKSRSMPERLGFVQEGTIRQAEWLYDHFVDHVVYGLLAEEWNKQ